MTIDEQDLRAFAGAFQRLGEEIHRLVEVVPPEPSALAQAIVNHLGVDTTGLPVVEQSFPNPDLPNLQLALEELMDGQDGARVLGLPIELMHWEGFGLANLANPAKEVRGFGALGNELQPPSYVNQPIDVDRTLPCVSLGIWLLRHDDTPVVVLMVVGDERRGTSGIRFQVLAPDRDRAQVFLADLKDRAHRLNVYRGKVLSFSFEEWGSFGLSFHPRPEVTRDDLILPTEDLDAIDRHTVGVAAHAERLVAAHRHLKRGLLLYGPPGTGKTFSIQYLCAKMPERTVVLLSGQAAPSLGQAAAIARSLAPSMLVLEDVDLVAMERTFPGMASNPLLFQLLNEMDGMDEDADVVFVLTTNRVELLEPALVARPGRIDQAVEIKLPDAPCRRRLLDRYLGGLTLAEVDLDAVVDRTEGVSAAFLKELGRRAAIHAAEATPDATDLVVTGEHLGGALDDLLEHSAPILRASLGLTDPSEIDPEDWGADEGDVGGGYVSEGTWVTFTDE
jgi:hypothetical protein